MQPPGCALPDILSAATRADCTQAAFTAGRYAVLRSLTLVLEWAICWDGAALLAMVEAMPHLQALHLYFSSQFPLRYPLTARHPRLRAFSLSSAVLPCALLPRSLQPLDAEYPITRDFFERQSRLEYLYLDYFYGEPAYVDPLGIFEFDGSSLPNLRALSLGKCTLSVVPTAHHLLASKTLEALKVVYSFDTSNDMVFPAPNLMCLHVDVRDSGGKIDCCVAMLAKHPSLTELRIWCWNTADLESESRTGQASLLSDARITLEC